MQVRKIVWLLCLVAFVILLVTAISNLDYINTQLPQTLLVFAISLIFLFVGLTLRRKIPEDKVVTKEPMQIAYWYLCFTGFSIFLGFTLYWGVYFLVGFITFPIAIVFLVIGMIFFRPSNKVLISYSLVPLLVIFLLLYFYTVLAGIEIPLLHPESG